MIMNQQVRNATRLIAHLKRDEATTMRSFIDANPELSMYFMDQIARKLRKAGLIRSTRGPGGGYLLTDRSVTMLDLVYTLSRRPSRTDDITVLVENKLSEIVLVREDRAFHASAH